MENPEKREPAEEDKHKLTLFDLPDEILLKVLRKLKTPNLVEFSKMNKKGKEISADKSIWQELLAYDFDIKLEKCPQDFDSFKAYYIQCHQWQSEILEKIQPLINLLDKLFQMYSSFISLFDRPGSADKELVLKSIKALINEINHKDIAEECLKAIEFGILLNNRHIFKFLFVREFVKTLDVYRSLYKQGNIFAGFEQVKLYNDLYEDEDKKRWPVMELDSTVVYEIALQLIDKYKFRELQLQQYIDHILDATESKIDAFKKRFMLRENTVKQIAKDYGQGRVFLNSILCFSPQELRLLQKIFLPRLITECSDEIEKKDYKKLFKDVNAAVDENYKALDSNIVQNITRFRFNQLINKMMVAINEENELSEASDSDVEDFIEDSDNDEDTRTDDGLGM